MIELWNSITFTTKFSAIAFVITAALGLFSMGFLGLGLYYPVSFLFKSYPDINSWRGDWVWAAIIGLGMAWSLGFVFGGVAWHFLSKEIHSITVLRLIYILILWIWAAILYFIVIKSNF